MLYSLQTLLSTMRSDLPHQPLKPCPYSQAIRSIPTRRSHEPNSSRRGDVRATAERSLLRQVGEGGGGPGNRLHPPAIGVSPDFFPSGPQRCVPPRMVRETDSLLPPRRLLRALLSCGLADGSDKSSGPARRVPHGRSSSHGFY